MPIPILFKKLKKSRQFVAGDETLIRELLHPKNDGFDLDYSLAHATVKVGQSSVPHILEKSSELYYILKGKGKAYIGAQEKIVKKGDLMFIPAGERQYITNIGAKNLQFICIVSPPWSQNQEVVL